MDVVIVKTIEGKNFNRFGEQVVPCVLCGEGTPRLGIDHCHRCHELNTRISMDLDLAARIVNYWKQERMAGDG